MEERHLSLSEAAAALDISERTAYRWVKSGKLRAYKPGRDYWIPESAIREVVEESEVRPKAPASSQPSFNGLLEEERRASPVFADALITTAEGLADLEPPKSLADVLKRFGILDVLYSIAEPLDDLALDAKVWEDLGEEQRHISRVSLTLHQAARRVLEQNNEYLERKGEEAEDRRARQHAEIAREQMRVWTRRLSA